MAYILLSDFKTWAGITTNTYDDFLSSRLDLYSNLIDDLTKQENGFTLTPNQTRTYKVKRAMGESYFNIGYWQTTNLTVKIGKFGGATLTTLVENQDYYLETPFALSNPVIGIKLITTKLYPIDYLQIEGTTGYSASLPSDLSIMLYQLVATAYIFNLQNKDGKSGIIQNEKDLTSAISYSVSPEYLSKANNIAMGNIEAVSSVATTILKYRLTTQEIYYSN